MRGKLSSIWLVLALGLLPWMPSRDSLWPDETMTYLYARQSTLQDWAAWLHQDVASEAQMPGGMLAAWVGVKVLGPSELSLRMLNVVWGALAILAVWFVGRRLEIPWLALFFAIQPFFWFYMNEARPYVLQIAAGAWLLLAFTEFIDNDGRGARWAWMASGAAVLLCASSMLGAITTAALMLVVIRVFLCRKEWRANLRWLPVLLGVALLCLLGVYYALTLVHGAGGVKLWKVGGGNVAFSLYEFGGFSGLGPPRQQLREIARAGLSVGSLGGAAVAGILILSGLYCLALVCLGRSDRSGKRGLFFYGYLTVFMISVALLFLAASVVHFPFWGRHLAPAFPFFVCFIAYGFAFDNSRRTLCRLVALGLGSVLLHSSLQLRFNPRHARDDYRSATAFARASIDRGRMVCWAADPITPAYYGLALPWGLVAEKKLVWPGAVRSNGRIVVNPENAPSPPDLIILSRPDVYDPSNVVQRFIEKHGYVRTGGARSFDYWEKRNHDQAP